MIRQFLFDGLNRLDLMQTRIIGGTRTSSRSGLERTPIEIGVLHRIEIQTNYISIRMIIYIIFERLGNRGRSICDHKMPIVVIIRQSIHEERGHIAFGEFLLCIAFRLNSPIRAVFIQRDEIDAHISTTSAQFFRCVIPHPHFSDALYP